MHPHVPPRYQPVVDEERAALARQVERARRLADADDLPALWRLAAELRRGIRVGNDRSGGHLRFAMDDLAADLDAVYDRAFPVGSERDPADVLTCPWPTASRTALLMRLGEGPLPMAALAWLAADALRRDDVGLLRAALLTPLGPLRRDLAVRALDALAAHGALDDEVVEHAFGADIHLGYAVAGNSMPGGAAPADEIRPAASLADLHDRVDELTWRLTAGPVPWAEVPRGLQPRGLRFVLRALTWAGEPEVAAHLGAASLTGAERTALVEHLDGRPVDERRRAFGLRLPAGDAEVLLPLLDLAGAEPLMRLIRATASPHEPVRHDRSAILAAAASAGDAAARRLLELYPSEGVAAALGHNRTAVEKRVRNNALQGIAAFGLLPLTNGETVLDRYLALREIGKRGVKLGPNRRHSHADAVAVALDHLAQVAGVPDAERLEWDCEARLAADGPGEWWLGDYSVEMRLDGAEPVLTVAKGGRPLKSVPAAVRAHAGYAEIRARQQALREQVARMRTGLIERLVASGATLGPEELARLRGLPAGAAMLPALIWQDAAGVIGLLDDVDATGQVTVAHPFLLFAAGALAGWQAEIVRRRVRQPVKQAFRELYVRTPAEDGTASHRFHGQAVAGKVAGQLLSGRGWRTHGEHDGYQATRPAGTGLTAALTAQLPGHFGGGTVVIGAVSFLADGAAVPLAEVPAVAFSEVMRDLDLVVSVAGSGAYEYSSPAQTASRAQLLAALITDLRLARVRIEGTSAVVTGTRATYRVHLTSGSIHLEPGGYLCVVPASFAATAHQRLFLPFADDDRMTSVILSKVLLLAEDERITDPEILTQLDHLAPGGAVD